MGYLWNRHFARSLVRGLRVFERCWYCSLCSTAKRPHSPSRFDLLFSFVDMYNKLRKTPRSLVVVTLRQKVSSKYGNSEPFSLRQDSAWCRPAASKNSALTGGGWVGGRQATPIALLLLQSKYSNLARARRSLDISAKKQRSVR